MGGKASNCCLIGLDFGTSSLKAGAFLRDGTSILVVSEPTPAILDGERAEFDLNSVWGVVSSLIRRLIAGLPRDCELVAIAAASVGEAGVPVDADGNELGRAISWNDRRTTAQGQWWATAVGADDIHRISGQTLDPLYGVSKLMWLREHEPSRFRATWKWLSLADWLTLQLSGRCVTDFSLASRTMVLDQRMRTWSPDLLAACGLSESIFPEIVPAGSIVGCVTAAAADSTGLPQGLPVAMGGHDRICGAFAVGQGLPAAVDSTGSAEAVVIQASKYVSRGAAEAGYVSTYADVVPGRYVHSARVGFAGALIDWLRRLTANGESGDALHYADLMALVPRPLRPSGIYLFPSFGRVVTPFWDPAAAPGLIAGLTIGTSLGDLVQAVLEATCFSLRASLTVLEELMASPVTSIFVEGGATRNDTWMQLKADITDREVTGVDLDEPTSLGAALLAGVAVGCYAGHGEAARAVALATRRWLPDRDRGAAYLHAYSRIYRELPKALCILSLAGD